MFRVFKGRYCMARITIEDCLREGYNKFELVHLATKRIIQLRKGKSLLVPTHNKEIVASLREIAAGKVVMREPGSLPAEDLLALESVRESLAADDAMPDHEEGPSSLEIEASEELEIIDEEDAPGAEKEDDPLDET
jgi:DNA-directed RNA polymerase subunit omega